MFGPTWQDTGKKVQAQELGSEVVKAEHAKAMMAWPYSPTTCMR